MYLFDYWHFPSDSYQGGILLGYASLVDFPVCRTAHHRGSGIGGKCHSVFSAGRARCHTVVGDRGDILPKEKGGKRMVPDESEAEEGI